MTRAEELLAILLRDGNLIEGGNDWADDHECPYCNLSAAWRKPMTVNDHDDNCPVREALRLVLAAEGKETLEATP